MSKLTELRDRLLGRRWIKDPEAGFLKLAGAAGPETLKFAKDLVVAIDGVDGTLDGQLTIPGSVKREIVVTLLASVLRKTGVTGISARVLRVLVEWLVARMRVTKAAEAAEEAPAA